MEDKPTSTSNPCMSSKGKSGQHRIYKTDRRKRSHYKHLTTTLPLNEQIIFWDKGRCYKGKVISKVRPGQYRVETANDGGLAFVVSPRAKPVITSSLIQQAAFTKGQQVLFFWREDSEKVELAYGKVIHQTGQQVFIQPSTVFFDEPVVALPEEVMINPYSKEDLQALTSTTPQYLAVSDDELIVKSLLHVVAGEIDDTKEKYERAKAYLDKQNPEREEIKQKYMQLHALYQDALLQIEDLKLTLFTQASRKSIPLRTVIQKIAETEGNKQTLTAEMHVMQLHRVENELRKVRQEQETLRTNYDKVTQENSHLNKVNAQLQQHNAALTEHAEKKALAEDDKERQNEPSQTLEITSQTSPTSVKVRSATSKTRSLTYIQVADPQTPSSKAARTTLCNRADKLKEVSEKMRFDTSAHKGETKNI